MNQTIETISHGALEQVTAPARDGQNGRAAADKAASAASLDQFYTKEHVAEALYLLFLALFDPALFLMVEPSAGAGAFLRLLPEGSLAFDLDPKFPGIVRKDFLTVRIRSDRPVAMVGNPPFGKNASLAVRFFNHAASQSDVIAMVLPRSVRKASIENRLDRDFHLVREVLVPDHAFVSDGRSRHVPAVFQIWERRLHPRPRRKVQTRHPDFEFTTPDQADFVVQRIGARAGRIHHDLTVSPSSHYFIRGPVEAVFRRLDLVGAAQEATGNPSLAKSEIVAHYRELVESQRLSRRSARRFVAWRSCRALIVGSAGATLREGPNRAVGASSGAARSVSEPVRAGVLVFRGCRGSDVRWSSEWEARRDLFARPGTAIEHRSTGPPRRRGGRRLPGISRALAPCRSWVPTATRSVVLLGADVSLMM